MATLFHFKKGNDKFKLLCFILLAASFLYYGFQKSKAGAFQFDDLQVLIMGSKAGNLISDREYDRTILVRILLFYDHLQLANSL